MKHFICRVVELDPKDYEFTPDESKEYTKLLLEQKSGNAKFSPAGIRRLEDLRSQRKVHQSILKGFRFTPFLVESDSLKKDADKESFKPMRLFKEEHQADRCGQRYLKRYKETGSFFGQSGVKVDVS